MSDKIVTACLVIIGNEILSGRTKDANLAHLGGRLNEAGIRLREARVIADDEAVIVATINQLRPAFDYVFTTGGIGPTHDDITAESIAKAFGVPLVIHPQARAILEAHYPPGQLNEGRLRMARTPEGASLILNAVSAAPGFRYENVFVMAGIPRVMQAMLETVLPQLSGGQPLESRQVTVFLAESILSPGLSSLQDRFPGIEIGSYPFERDGRFGVTVVLRAVESAQLEEAVKALKDLISGLGAEVE